MSQYYIHLETTGFNKDRDQIISISYQPIGKDCKPSGDLTVLKEWESNEKQIVEEFHKTFYCAGNWNFIPIGYNLVFELTFLWAKFKKYNLSVIPLDEFIYERPLVECKYSSIIGNNLSFRGTGLDVVSGKNDSGMNVSGWYKIGDFKKVESCIIQETEIFMEFFKKLNGILQEIYR